MSAITSGKLVNLQRLTDANGRFKMLAIDQRDSLRNAIGKATGRTPGEVTYADLAEAKAVITRRDRPRSSRWSHSGTAMRYLSGGNLGAIFGFRIAQPRM